MSATISCPGGAERAALWRRLAALPIVDGPEGEAFLSRVRRVSGESAEAVRERVAGGVLPYALLALTGDETAVPPPAVGALLDLLKDHPSAEVRDVFAGIEEPYFDTDDALIEAYARTLAQGEAVFGAALPCPAWPAPRELKQQVGCNNYNCCKYA